ncbi:hypothetical protein HDU77_001012 [Chytriomyces hyalinus]|nr:hypothetical protein HDU77_001012 [Chytriomyces hyalinus]
MSKFQSALIILVTLSAIAVVATAAARFASATTAPTKRRSSNGKTRASPQESQALRPAEATETIYIPRPVFIRSDHITSFNRIPISETPIYIPLPIFQNTQGFALSQTGANETSDYITNAHVSGHAAGATHQPGIPQIPFVAENSVVVPETKIAKPVSVPSTLDSSATHQLKSEIEPLYSLDWNETQNAWKYVLSSAAPSKEHSATVGTAVKEAVVPAAAPHQVAGVTSTLFSLDEHEMQNVWKIAPIYNIAMLLPENTPSSPVPVPAIKSQPISSIVPVKSTDVPLFALSSSDFEISQIYITDMLATGPLGIRQIPYASESVPSKAAIQAPVATCNVEKTAEKKRDEKKEEKKEAKIEAKKQEKKEEKKKEKEEEEKEEKCVAKIEKAEAKPVSQTSSAPTKSSPIAQQPLSLPDCVATSKIAVAKLESMVMDSVHCARAIRGPHARRSGLNPLAREFVAAKTKVMRLNPDAAAWEPSSAPKRERNTILKGLNPFAPTFQPSSTVFIPVSPELSAGSSNPVFLGSDPAEVHHANDHTSSRSNRSHGMRLKPHAGVWERSDVSSSNENGKSLMGLNPFAPVFQSTASGAFENGHESLNSGLNQLRRPQYPNVIEKVAVPAADAIVPKYRGSFPSLLFVKKSSRKPKNGAANRAPRARPLQGIYVLAFSFMFSTWGTWVQARTLPNVILVTIVLCPGGKTIGNFLDTSFLLVACVLFSAAIWAFTQAVAGESYTAMAVILFVVVYIFSTLRAINPARFFVASLVAPLFTFTAISSVVGVNGPNTTNKQLFDSNFLISTINSYLIGIAICLTINVLVFPDFAATHLNVLFISTVKSISSLLISIIGALSGSESTKELYDLGVTHRNGLVATIQRNFGIIDATINQASAEVSYSHYSIKDYTRLLKACKGVVAIMCSLHTSLKSDSSQRLLSSREFIDQIAPSMKDSWVNLESCCKQVLEEIEFKLESAKSKAKVSSNMDAEAALLEKVMDASRNATEAMRLFERHRPNEFLNIFSESAEFKGLTEEQKESWDKLILVTFHTLATKELVNSLNQLHSAVYCSTGNNLHIRLHLKHYVPGFVLYLFSPKATTPKHVVAPETRVTMLVTLKNLFLSPPSIFGLKLATAAVCFLMILYSQPSVFQQWSFGGSFMTILVAISPSLGQTYMSLPVQIVATTLGASIAYGGVSAFGRDGAYGLTGFAAILGVPFFYLMLNNFTFFILSLLTLLSFSNYVIISFANRNNPRFPSPDVSLYRGVAVTSSALTFSLIFTLVLYPTLSRHVLRHRMFEIFRDFSIYYRKIIVSTVNVPEDSNAIISIHPEDNDIKDTRDNILLKLASLEPLMAFAAVEPRLAGKFPVAKYRAVITNMYTFVDRVEALRVSGGDAPFDANVRKFLNFGVLGETRIEMQQTIRILGYIYASVMLTKQRLPPSLPNASKARDKLLQAFVLIIMNHVHHVYPPETDPLADMPFDKEGVLATLNTEKWLRLLSFSASAREVSNELDRFGVLMKDIFGEYPDVVERKPNLEDAEQPSAWLTTA